VAPGECFGLLGTNGAGKSTLLKMLTGEERPSEGDANVSGFSVVSQMQDVRREVGYCPQTDPLFDLLTAREHLQLYARVRGVSESDLNGVVEPLLTQLGLSPFADQVGSLITHFASASQYLPSFFVLLPNSHSSFLFFFVLPDQVTQGYSGGTKRKLSLALALVGDPVGSARALVTFICILCTLRTQTHA
jgi:ABC-type multidrug transport system ATPase subunit